MDGLWHCSVAPLVSSSQHTCSHPAEVEDKRQALEDEVAQLRRQTVRWRRRVDAGEQQRKKLQAQLNMMAQMQGSKADKSKLDRLEQSLSQAKSDQHMLMRQVKKLEEQLEESNRLLRHARAGDSAAGDNGYVQFLQTGECRRAPLLLRLLVWKHKASCGCVHVRV